MNPFPRFKCWQCRFWMLQFYDGFLHSARTLRQAFEHLEFWHGVCNQCCNRLKDDKLLHTNPIFACGMPQFLLQCQVHFWAKAEAQTASSL